MSLFIKFGEDQFSIGDTIKVDYKIKEKDKERIQAFDGIIISITGKDGDKNFTVHKNATDGVAVERIFPLSSPWIASIKKIHSPKNKVRRSKLYYLRQSKTKSL